MDQQISTGPAAPLSEAVQGLRMPVAVKVFLGAIVALLVCGSLYLLAVRGDALLADLAAVAALICG